MHLFPGRRLHALLEIHKNAIKIYEQFEHRLCPRRLPSYAMARVLRNGSRSTQWLAFYAMARVLRNGSRSAQWLAFYAMARVLRNGSLPVITGTERTTGS